MTRYDWSKLDAGWIHSDGKLCELYVDDSRCVTAANLDCLWMRRHWDVSQLEKITGVPIGESTQAALDQLAKCRIRDTERAPVDNTPLFEAMDRMAEEVPKEEWERVPPVVHVPSDEFLRRLSEPVRCPACGKMGLHLCEKFYPEPTPTKWFYPSQPWRRGPLASWTLVNISAFDGRLTVVMKRGRGELVMETGPDDETLWERLAQKVESYSTR